MDESLVKVAPDREKAASMLRMAKTTCEMVETIDIKKFPSNVVKEYYDIIRELMTALLLLDGYKTYGEGAHRKSIEYLAEKYKGFTGQEIHAIEELRLLRNRISYDGFFIQEDYAKRKEESIKKIINKLIKHIEERI